MYGISLEIDSFAWKPDAVFLRCLKGSAWHLHYMV